MWRLSCACWTCAERRWVLLLLFFAHVILAQRLLWQRVQEPLWWPLLAGWLLLPVFYVRSAGAVWRLGWQGRLLLGLDVVLLVWSAVRGSGWLAWFALAVFMAAVLLGRTNRAGDRSLFRLSLLPLLSAGVPPFLADRFGVEFPVRLAEACSVLGAGWGWETVLSGSSVLGVGGEFSLEQLCSGGLCWTWVLSAGLWWALLQRRSVLQSVLLLVCACAVAGAGLLAGGLWCVWWLSAGAGAVSAVDINGLLLVPQLLLVLSADSLLLFLTSPVLRPELLEARRETGVFEQELLNPLEVFWNRFVAAERRSFGQRVEFRMPDGTALPWARMIRLACETWFSTRSVWFLILGLPAVVLMISAGAAISRVSAERAVLSVRVEARLNEALAGGSLQSAEHFFQVLEGYGLASPVLRYRFAEALWRTGDRASAWREMLELSEFGASGLAAAHLWLVERAQEPEPFQELSLAEQQRHLELALRTEAGDAEIYRHLAEVLLRLGETALAERQLLRAAELNSEYVNALFRLRSRRGGLQLPDAMLNRRLQQLQEQLADEAGVRVVSDSLQLAELYVLSRQPQQAEVVLRSGLRKFPSEELRRGLSELLSGRVAAQMDAVNFDGRSVRRDVEEAIELWPTGAVGVRLAARLLLSGVVLRREPLEQLRGVWLSGEAETIVAGADADEIPMLRALVKVLLWDAGELSLEPSVLRVTEDGPLLLGLVRLRGASEQAGLLTEHFLERLSGAADDAVVPLLRWRVLLAAGRYAELRTEVAGLPGAEGRDRAGVDLLLGRSWLDEFDEIAGRPRTGIEQLMRWVPAEPMADEAAEQLQRLREAAAVPAVRTLAIDRLCRVVLSGGAWGELAERELTVLRAAGLSAEYLLGRVGDLAAAMGRYEQAVPWQRQALAAAAQRSYLRLNNLAICLLRAEGVRAADECQQLVEEALRLRENHPQLLATRGEILLRRGEHVRARGDLEASLAVAPGSGEVWELLAECCALGGDEVAAMRARAERARLEGLAAEPN